jgi:hypothetical protein
MSSNVIGRFAEELVGGSAGAVCGRIGEDPPAGAAS